MVGKVGFVFGLIAVVLVQHATAQTVHVVGDSTGWSVPRDDPTFYSKWASKNKFAVGDSLTFNFGTFTHNVAKVTKESFDACNPDNAIGNVLTTGPATVKLDTAGEHYFICSIGKHCSGGQKLSVTVSTESGGAVSASSPSTTTPSDNDASAPTTTDSASLSPPKENKSPVAPAPSSSVVVVATLYGTLSAIVMSLLF